MNKKEWLKECSDQFITKGAFTDHRLALKLAETCYEESDPLDDPKEAADIEMSYWEG